VYVCFCCCAYGCFCAGGVCLCTVCMERVTLQDYHSKQCACNNGRGQDIVTGITRRVSKALKTGWGIGRPRQALCFGPCTWCTRRRHRCCRAGTRKPCNCWRTDIGHRRDPSSERTVQLPRHSIVQIFGAAWSESIQKGGKKGRGVNRIAYR